MYRSRFVPSRTMLAPSCGSLIVLAARVHKGETDLRTLEAYVIVEKDPTALLAVPE